MNKDQKPSKGGQDTLSVGEIFVFFIAVTYFEKTLFGLNPKLNEPNKKWTFAVMK